EQFSLCDWGSSRHSALRDANPRRSSDRSGLAILPERQSLSALRAAKPPEQNVQTQAPGLKSWAILGTSLRCGRPTTHGLRSWGTPRGRKARQAGKATSRAHSKGYFLTDFFSLVCSSAMISFTSWPTVGPIFSDVL